MRTYYFTAAAAAAAADWYTFGIAPQLPVQNPPKFPNFLNDIFSQAEIITRSKMCGLQFQSRAIC